MSCCTLIHVSSACGLAKPSARNLYVMRKCASRPHWMVTALHKAYWLPCFTFENKDFLEPEYSVFHTFGLSLYKRKTITLEIITKYGILISEWGDRQLNKTHLLIGKSYLAIISSSQNFKFKILYYFFIVGEWTL